MANQNNKPRKVSRQNWRPSRPIVILRGLWTAAYSVLKIALGALVTVLLIAGVCMVVFVAPKLFKESWFECAIADFGQATGVTATGLLLLRAVDPESKTCAAQAFGYKQLLHEPVMGGGLWTALALTLLYRFGWQIMLLISAVMLVIWIILAVIVSRRKQQ